MNKTYKTKKYKIFNSSLYPVFITLFGGRHWQWGNPSWLLAAKRRGQHIDADKCGVSWSPLTNHQWPGTFSRHTPLLPPTENFTEVLKVPFSSYSQTAGLVYLILLDTTGGLWEWVISGCCTIRER